MPSTLAKPGLKIAKRMLVLQSLVTLFSTLIAGLLFHKYSAISALLGGMAAILPNMLYTAYAFRYAGGSQIQLIYKSFKTGSKLKLFLTIVIFMLIFRWPHVQAAPLFITFVITLLSQWAFGVKSPEKMQSLQ